jgi:heat shock protein beta
VVGVAEEMLGASRRSVCTAAAAAAAGSRRRAAAGVASAVSGDSSVSSSSAPPRSVINGEPGVPQLQKRLLSVLAAPKLTGTDNAASLKLREGSLVGRRYESSAAAVDSSDTPPVEKHEYQAEVNRLMDLIVHSLYSNKEVFLRELVSNASDALDKLRYLSVTDPDLIKDGAGLDIRIQTDKENGIITIT